MNAQGVAASNEDEAALAPAIPMLQPTSVVTRGEVSQRSGRTYGKWTKRFTLFRRNPKATNESDATGVAHAALNDNDETLRLDEHGFVLTETTTSPPINGQCNPMSLSYCNAYYCRESVDQLCLALGNTIPPEVAWDGSLQMLIEYALQARLNDSGASINKVLLNVIRNNDHCSRTRNETNGTFLLHLACRYNAPFDILQLLLEQNPNAILVMDGKGMLPLHHACSNTDTPLDTIQLLLKHYPSSIQSQTANQAYPLHLAIDFHVSFDVIQFLVEQDSSIVQTRDGIGRLPLHCACSGVLETWNHDVVMLLLTKYPESLQVADNFGSLPLHDVAQSIAKRDVDTDKERATTQILHAMLCRYPGAVSQVDYRGLLPLHLACMLPVTMDDHTNIHRIRDLIEVNPFSILSKCNYGCTPLKLSCRNNQSMAIRTFLLEKQQEAVQAIRNAFNDAMDALPFPDLVISKVWKYAKPDVWEPRSNNNNNKSPSAADDATWHPVLPGGRRWLNVAGRR